MSFSVTHTHTEDATGVWASARPSRLTGESHFKIARPPLKSIQTKNSAKRKQFVVRRSVLTAQLKAVTLFSRRIMLQYILEYQSLLDLFTDSAFLIDLNFNLKTHVEKKFACVCFHREEHPSYLNLAPWWPLCLKLGTLPHDSKVIKAGAKSRKSLVFIRMWELCRSPTVQVQIHQEEKKEEKRKRLYC